MAAGNKFGELEVWDIVVIAAYFVIVLGVGLWSSWRSSRGSVSGYFLAGRNMHWILVGASLFASNIGSGHFVGLAGSGAAGGIAVAGFELNAIFVLVALGWLFAPVYIASGVYTMPEYLKKRFGGNRISIYLAALALLLYVFTKISVDLFAGAIFINQSVPNISLYPSIGILLVIACIFTVAGGLTAVIWTDAVQVVIMLIGAFILMIMSFNEVGGYAQLMEKYFTKTLPTNYNSSTPVACIKNAFPRTDALELLRDVKTGDLPWTGMTFGLTVSAVWYWCSDQVIVQRALAAKNYSHAKGGCVFAGWLKFLPLWLMIFPGMIARVLYTEDIVCTTPEDCEAVCQISTGCSNAAYPKLVVRLLPVGLRGVMLACMLSALMSSLTSVFNSSSTIFTMDVWRFIRKKASDMELLIVGRVFVIALVIVGIVWIRIIQSFPSSELFNYIQSVTSYLAPPVCAVYVLAIFVPRTNEPGAFWGLMIGLVVGLARFIVEIAYGSVPCDQTDTRPWFLTGIHYLHFGCILFVISFVVTLAVSFITAPIDKKHLYRLTFWTRHSKQERECLAELTKKTKKLDAQAYDNPVFTVDSSASDDNKATPKVSMGRRALNFALGMNQKNKEQSRAEIEQQEENMISIKENNFWKMFWNVNAIIVISCAVFVYVLYL